MEKFYTLKQFAEIEGSSVRTVQRRIAAGEGPVVTEISPRLIRIADEDAKAHWRARRKLPPGYKEAAAEARES
jgi:hypothetical protein